MTCAEMRSSLKKLGRKMSGNRDDLLDRLLEPVQTNDRGWKKICKAELDGAETFLAEGEFRRVFKEQFCKGPRKGEYLFGGLSCGGRKTEILEGCTDSKQVY